ncbi:MAG: pilus assembly protein PilM [Clostridiales bacterium]|nr:pilus assembly protein PilM [Clostridiales bacterium]
MALKVLSFEIGQATTKVVEMDYKTKNPKIYNAFTIETPADVVQDGVINRNEEFIVAIKSELRRRMIKTKNVVFTVASSRIANREARIPLCKQKNILPIIMANASDYFPVDMNQYHLVYNILGTIENEEGKQYRLSLLAVPNDVTTSYIDLARTLEFELKAIDFVGNSVYQAVKEEFGTGTKAVLKIEEHASLVTVVNNGEIVLQRQVAHGLNQAVENLMETDIFEGEELTYAGASRKFLENKIIRPHLNLDAGVSSDDADEENLMVKVMITENLRYMVGNISRILEYFTSRNEGMELTDVYLIGLGADFEGLPELLTNELGYNVQPYHGLDNITVQNVDPNAKTASMRQMAACIGAAEHPLQLLSDDLLKGEKEINLLAPFIVFAGGIGLAIALVLIGGIMLKAEQSKTEKLEKELQSYDYLASFIDEYNKTKDTYTKTIALDNGTSNYNNELTSFISELESKMPTDFKASTFSVSANGVVIGVEVSSKDEAAKVIEQLRTFKSIASISTGSFTETVDEKDPEKKIVTFSVSIAYKTYNPKASEETK